MIAMNYEVLEAHGAQLYEWMKRLMTGMDDLEAVHRGLAGYVRYRAVSEALLSERNRLEQVLSLMRKLRQLTGEMEEAVRLADRTLLDAAEGRSVPYRREAAEELWVPDYCGELFREEKEEV